MGDRVSHPVFMSVFQHEGGTSPIRATKGHITNYGRGGDMSGKIHPDIQ